MWWSTLIRPTPQPPLLRDDVYDDENKFRIGGNLYSYDSGDVFISGGKDIDMAEFEKQLTADSSAVQVVAYSSDSDGTSIFVVSNTG